MNIVVWGTGQIADAYVRRKAYHINDTIVAFTDNNKALWGGSIWGCRILAPMELLEKEFDRLVICSVHFKEIQMQIKKMSNIDFRKVVTYCEIEEEIKDALIRQYKDSCDNEIQKVLEYYKTKRLNVFGYYERAGETMHPVSYEADGMPYIWFENKKMYYPRNYKFSIMDHGKCVRNILKEQGEHSPHRYIRSNTFTGENMVIVDAGVCEGNFALRYVEAAKKIYLIEPDRDWIEALYRTFAAYQDKVVFCDKFLSEKDGDFTITLDKLVNEKIDFLKMDIEGYEKEALRGGRKVLSESNASCAICSYHKHDDEIGIKNLLEGYGYQTEVSEGYMFFPYDNVLEFRKGIVYAQKQMCTK